MFPSRMFPNRMFAPRYFPKVGADPVIPADPMDGTFIHQQHFIRESVVARQHPPERGSHVGAQLLPFWRFPAFQGA